MMIPTVVEIAEATREMIASNIGTAEIDRRLTLAIRWLDGLDHSEDVSRAWWALFALRCTLGHG